MIYSVPTYVLRGIILLLAVVKLTGAFAQAPTPTPFDCSTGLAYILTNVNSPAVGNVTSLYSVNLSTGASLLIKDGFIPPNSSGSTSRFLNGVGYNPVDNFLYGYRNGTNQIIKLGRNGEIQPFSVSGLTMGYTTGDISSTGVLYLYSPGSRIITSVDLTTTPYTVQDKLTLPANNFIATGGLNDWAFSPIDGNIYGMTTNKVLFVYNVAANTVTNLGNVTGLDTQSGAFGSAFMDSQGNLFVGNNNSGNIYRIATPHVVASPRVATFFSDNLAGRTPGDGARCANQVIPPSAADDQTCLSNPDSPVSLTVATNDGVGTFPLNPGSVRLIDPATNSPATSVTIPEGTYSVNTTTGVVTFTPTPGFVSSSIKYRISDTQGNVSGDATISIFNRARQPVVAATDPSCTVAGSLTVTAPVGANVTYSVSGGTYQASPVFSGLAAGNYSVVARYTTGNCPSQPTPISLQQAQGPVLGPITGTTNPCSAPTSSTYAYTNSTPGGTWSVSPTTSATINASTGILTTVANSSGSATITYTVRTGSCTSTATLAITISPTNCTPMPVALVNFTAQAQANQTVLINWKTSWEQNNQRFVIERSKNLLDFDVVGQVSDVAGSSNSINSYRFVDNSPYRGTSYYRLTQVDRDGTQHTYKAVSVILEGHYGVAPNPVVGNSFTLELDEPDKAVIHLYDLTGREVAFRKLNPTETSVRLQVVSVLTPGIYVLTVAERGVVRKHRIVVP